MVIRSRQFRLSGSTSVLLAYPIRLDDAIKLREVLQYHDQAKLFWRQLLQQANVTQSLGITRKMKPGQMLADRITEFLLSQRIV